MMGRHSREDVRSMHAVYYKTGANVRDAWNTNHNLDILTFTGNSKKTS